MECQLVPSDRNGELLKPNTNLKTKDSPNDLHLLALEQE